VRRGLKIVVWVGVFAVCAGAGAFVAAHTNPFPPGVEDPGARSTTPPSTSPSPASERWSLAMMSATRHELHVGGACRSAFRTTGAITVRPDGVASGEARAVLRGWGCDFPVAQVQTRSIRLAVSGKPLDGRLDLRFYELVGGSSPKGTQDLGGFIETLPLLNLQVRLTGERERAGASVLRPDGDLGRYVNDSRIQLACATGC